MFGLGKKSAAPLPADSSTQPTVEVHTLPSEFYGGANPIIQFKEVRKQIIIGNETSSTPTTLEKRAFAKSQLPGLGQALHPATLFANRRMLLVVGAAIFVIAIAGAAVYYIWLAPSAAPLAPASPPPPLALEATTTPELAPTPATTTEPVPELAPAPGPQPFEFPSLILGDAPDGDNDQLNDLEEQLFGTDPGVPDTDLDKYLDGHEVYNLYNPAGQEPIKLLSSGLVATYTNPSFAYEVYYPKSWAVAPVDPTDREILLSSATGEYISIRALDKDIGEDFPTWFAHAATGEQLGTLVEFASAFKQTGARRADYLVYYFPTPNRVYVIVYHPNPGQTIAVSFRSIAKLVARSFHLTTSQAIIPDRIVEESTVPDAVASPATTTVSTSTPL